MFWLLVLCSLLGTGAFASDDLEYQESRQQEAEESFEAVMEDNEWSNVRNQRRPAPRPGLVKTPVSGGEVVVPLERFEAVRTQLDEAQAQKVEINTPLVVLGASSFAGRATDGALSLSLELGVTLSGEGLYKTVPLVGQEVVIVQAHTKGTTTALPLSSQNGYHVWITDQTGEVTLQLDVLVPSQGRRGSLEYDFLIAKTPSTSFQCFFPTAGLEPRLRSAVRAEVSPSGNGTLLTASMEPTSRVHLVGFRDVGSEGDRKARVYAESSNLLSVEPGSLDLFSVIRYNILYAGTKSFDVIIPPGMTVISADGEGAFRYSLESLEQGTVLRGETAFPIRNSYELSLRLRREMADSGEAFELVLPRCADVEREYGWVGVEITGNLKLEEVQRSDVVAVDVRQLPWEMVMGAISPILKAYRFHSPEARIVLTAAQLPEKEAASASVDVIDVTTTVSAEGTVLTDMRITLRNRLRHSLALRLPEGMEVRSTHLDGQPVKPARSSAGSLLFPLKRSSGGSRLERFTLQVVLQSHVPTLPWMGKPELVLPSVELPVSTLHWSVYLPSGNQYSRLESDIKPQNSAGHGQWYRPADDGQVSASGFVSPQAEGTNTGGAGAMPIRIELPLSEKHLDISRYWLEEGEPVSVAFWCMRGWLLAPAVVVLLLLLIASVTIAGRAQDDKRSRNPVFWGSMAATVALCWILLQIGTSTVMVATVVLGFAAIAWTQRSYKQLFAGMRDWFRQRIWPEPDAASDQSDDDPQPTPPAPWVTRSVSAIALICFGGLVGVLSLITTIRVMAMLLEPLAG
ncbi:MAG: hypothetical protein HN348_17670 [Proteobacteria bacterium]|nr:hypothetical protein [Pseudomonadota bacterium]